MSIYTVNATLSVAAWITMEADSEDEAVSLAHDAMVSDFEYDLGSGEIEFNVSPLVEVSR